MSIFDKVLPWGVKQRLTRGECENKAIGGDGDYGGSGYGGSGGGSSGSDEPQGMFHPVNFQAIPRKPLGTQENP